MLFSGVGRVKLMVRFLCVERLSKVSRCVNVSVTLLWPTGKHRRVGSVCTREAENATDEGTHIHHVGLIALTY